MLGLDTRFAPSGKEPLQPFMLEAADHKRKCNPMSYGIQYRNEWVRFPALEVIG